MHTQDFNFLPQFTHPTLFPRPGSHSSCKSCTQKPQGSSFLHSLTLAPTHPTWMELFRDGEEAPHVTDEEPEPPRQHQ